MRILNYDATFGLKVSSTISKILTYDPKTNPTIPNIMSNKFFHNLYLYGPKPGFSQSVTSSIIAGNTNPNIDKHTAPTSEIKPPRFGTAIAMTTVIVVNVNRKMYSTSPCFPGK